MAGMSGRQVTVVCAFGAFGAVAALGASYLVHSRHQTLLRDQPYFRKALSVMDANPRVLEMLGKPIKVGNMDPFQKGIVMESDEVQLIVPVKGKLNSGHLFIAAHREPPSFTWIVDKISLTVSKGSEYQGKSFVLHRGTSQPPRTSSSGASE